MFVIIAKTAAYDNRDACCGSRTWQANPNTYETAALAGRLCPSSYDENGDDTEVSYYVADAADPYRRPVVTQAAADAVFADLDF